MCKSRIEGALKGKTAIQSADWNAKSKMLTVVYEPQSISILQIHQLIASAGHDTELVKTTDAVYKKLHSCCQYKRE
jgi:copper chaperone CopZ